MKYLILSIGVFAAFFSSCNIFTLTGAQTEIGFNNYAGATPLPPIVTSASVSNIGSGSPSDCGAGQIISLYGTGFTSDMSITLFNTATGTTHSASFGNITNTEVEITLPAGLPGTESFGFHVANQNGESKAFAFSTSCI